MSDEIVTAVAKLQVQLENVASAVDNHKEVVNRAIADGKEERKELEKRLAVIEKKVDTWAIVIKTLKVVGGTTLLVLTFKFGSIKGLWGK